MFLNGVYRALRVLLPNYCRGGLLWGTGAEGGQAAKLISVHDSNAVLIAVYARGRESGPANVVGDGDLGRPKKIGIVSPDLTT